MTDLCMEAQETECIIHAPKLISNLCAFLYQRIAPFFWKKSKGEQIAPLFTFCLCLRWFQLTPMRTSERVGWMCTVSRSWRSVALRVI